MCKTFPFKGLKKFYKCIRNNIKGKEKTNKAVLRATLLVAKSASFLKRAA